MSIEKSFDISFIAALALKEKQIQQNYRPIIAVHKWFARRPGTLFRGLALAEFGKGPIDKLFYQTNDFPDIKVADPFMGGGTPLVEANRIGCDVIGYDINPMAAWIVREELEQLDLDAYENEAGTLLECLRSEIGALYRTDCPLYGERDVPVKYFLWVKVIDCESCGEALDLFPGHVIAKDRRHPKAVMVCPDCGELNETDDPKRPGSCRNCSASLTPDGSAKRNKCLCRRCGHLNRYPRPESGPPRHRLFAIEYYNPERKAGHRGRFFKKPDEKDLWRVRQAGRSWADLTPRFVPEREIPPGDETRRLHRWGYRHYREMFNDRQLLGLELSCRLIEAVEDERVRNALATNLSDLLRYQNMLCRYDVAALKSLDIFSIHGFPVGLIQCESNLPGIANGRGGGIGSGGWVNIIDKYRKAKAYCDAPFEMRRAGTRFVRQPVRGERIGEKLNGRRRRIDIRCASSTESTLEPRSLDAVLTDPPYFGNVQYGELMDFCYAWLRRLVGHDTEGFDRLSTHSDRELTGNVTQERDLEHFTQGLAAVYRRMAEALKPGAPLVFTFHHNRFAAYSSIGVAILDAGLTCSASIPCPAEMGGSIHIHGTESSIVDTVFVCRSLDSTPRRLLFTSVDELKTIIAEELLQLVEAGMKPTAGDCRCIVYGHLTRAAIGRLRRNWNFELPTASKLQLFDEAISAFGNPDQVLAKIEDATDLRAFLQSPKVQGAHNLELFDAISL